MIAELRPYPDMKDSGVPWLGEVPAHWEVLPNRATFSDVKDREHPQEQMLSVTIGGGVVRQKELLEDGSKKDSSRLDKTAYKLVERGDIAYNKMRAWQGAIGVSAHRGIVSPAYVVQRPRNGAHSRYLHHLLRTPAFAEEAERWSYGITSDMWSLRPEHFRMIYGCLPPISEQTAIVRFLDHADRRIRRYIRAKQKLIVLLEEQKQAIVHQAVTGQADVRTGQSYPAYKPSGVEWLGDVPAHWEVSRFGRFIDLTVGFPFKSEGFSQSEHDLRLLRGVNIAPGRLRWEDLVRWPATDLDAYSDYWLAVGDIVLGMDRPIIGSGTRVAMVTHSDVPSLLLQRVASIRPDGRKLTRNFAFRLLSDTGFSDYLAPIFTGISVPHLSPDQIKDFRVAVPELAEQEAIEEHLRLIFGNVQAAMDRARSHIGLFHEYRTRLIADVVTGKLDAREAAAALPELDTMATEDDLDDTFDTDTNSALDELDVTLEEVEA